MIPKRYPNFLTKKYLCIMVIGIAILFYCFGAKAASAIRIFVNGQEIYSDVPAQEINGRVMVPIRAISESMGASVQWDNQNNSVNIYSSSNDFQRAKILNGISLYYSGLQYLADTLKEYSDGMTIILYNPNPSNNYVLLKNNLDKADNSAKLYDHYVQESQGIINEAMIYNIDISNTKSIISDLGTAYDLSIKVVNAFLDYAESNDVSYLNDFNKYNSELHEISSNVSKTCLLKHFEYSTMIEHMGE